MAQPTDRASFKEFCLRKLGKPVIEINVSDDQVDDRLEQALSYFADYHFDGSEKVYYKQALTQTDIDNQYITLPENIIGAVRIFQIGSTMVGSMDMFNINYQIALNDLYTLTSVSMVPYFMSMTNLSLMSEMLVGQQPIRYNRHDGKLFIDMDWRKVNPGRYLVVEAYQVVDPTAFPAVWKDRWLQNYTTALIKEQWGQNLTKFTGMSLPGGVQFNGERILTDAQNEITKMEAEMINSYSLPPEDYMG